MGLQDGSSSPESRHRGRTTLPHETLLIGADFKLHGRLWVGSQSPTAVLVVVHGLGDHSGRFSDVAKSIICDGEGTDQDQCVESSEVDSTTKKNSGKSWAVLAFDLPGHGKSPGPAGKVRNFASLLEHIAAASELMTRRFGDLPQVILGHSMGGNLAINYLLRRSQVAPDAVEPIGLVLCAPMLLPPTPMPRPWIFAAWITGYLLPFLRFGHSVNPEQLTSDEQEILAIQNDEALHSKISLHLATQLVAQGRWAIDQARNLDTPTLIMVGEDDTMIDKAACRNLAIRIGPQATLANFANTKHAIFHDLARDRVLQRLNSWLHQLTDEST